MGEIVEENTQHVLVSQSYLKQLRARISTPKSIPEIRQQFGSNPLLIKLLSLETQKQSNVEPDMTSPGNMAQS